MNISITPKLEAFVRERVASGMYNNASEVIREALRRWIESDGWTPTPITEPTHLERLVSNLHASESALRSHGVQALHVVGEAAHLPTHVGEVELLLDFHPDARVNLLTLASIKSLCEGASGRPVKPLSGGALPSAQREALLLHAKRVF